MGVALQDDIAGGWSPARVLRVSLVLLVALVALKFVALLAASGWRLSQAPVPLLVVVAVPGIALAMLLGRRPKMVAWVAAPIMLLFAVVVIAALARDGLARESWADYPFAYGGLAVAAAGLVSSVSLLRGRSAQPVG